MQPPPTDPSHSHKLETLPFRERVWEQDEAAYLAEDLPEFCWLLAILDAGDRDQRVLGTHQVVL